MQPNCPHCSRQGCKDSLFTLMHLSWIMQIQCITLLKVIKHLVIIAALNRCYCDYCCHCHDCNSYHWWGGNACLIQEMVLACLTLRHSPPIENDSPKLKQPVYGLLTLVMNQDFKDLLCCEVLHGALVP